MEEMLSLSEGVSNQPKRIYFLGKAIKSQMEVQLLPH